MREPDSKVRPALGRDPVQVDPLPTLVAEEHELVARQRRPRYPFGLVALVLEARAERLGRLLRLAPYRRLYRGTLLSHRPSN